MAQLMLRIEVEPAFDAVESLVRAHDNLRRRHGERFRRLERKIEAAAEDDALLVPTFETLNDGTLVVSGPPQLTALIVEARSLGVI